MKVKLGTDVKTFDDETIGRVKEVVIDPATQEITHLIVEQGILFKEDKVLPISLIMQSTDQEIKLIETDEELAELPEYQEEYYLPIEAQPTHDPGLALSRSFLIARPRIVPKNRADVRFISRGDYQQHLPEDIEMLEIGDEVFSLDEELIGRIRELVLNAKTNQISHLVLDRALLKDDKVLIPYRWVDEMSENQVHLKVDKQVIKNLPPHLED